MDIIINNINEAIKALDFITVSGYSNIKTLSNVIEALNMTKEYAENYDKEKENIKQENDDENIS